VNELSVKDKMTLDFERQWWKYPGAKDAAIHTHFAETTTRYYQRLNALIDRPRPWRTTRSWSSACAGSATPT
jgi:hypothetical protein